MKRDRKLQRLLLLQVRDGQEPPELSSYPEAEQVYNSALLINDGYVEGEAIRGGNGEYVSAVMTELTSAGQDLLEAMGSNTKAEVVSRNLAKQTVSAPRRSNRETEQSIDVAATHPDADHKAGLTDLLSTGSARPFSDVFDEELARLLNTREWSQSLRGVFQALAEQLKPIWVRGRIARLTVENVVLGLIRHGLDYRNDPAHVAGKLSSISNLTQKEINGLLTEGVWLRPESDPQASPHIVDPKLESIFQRAEQIAQTVSSDKVIAVRHLVAAILQPPTTGAKVGSSCQLPENIFQAVRFAEALIDHVRTARHIRSTDDPTKWEAVLKELETGLSTAEKPKDKKDDDKATTTNVGGGLNFSREATPEEVCLRAGEYAEALKSFFIASQSHGELCFALFGHWGRGKSFLMNLTSGLMKGYETIRFSAWKYPNVPEVWVHLYENFAHAAYPKNLLQSFPRILRTGIAKHGGGKIITALAALAFALFPKPDISFLSQDLLQKIELAIGAGGVTWLLVLLSGVWKTTQRLNKDFLTATRHRDKLGLQATIGDDLEALLHGWMPGKRPKYCGWLFWFLVFMVCLIAGSAWWRIERVAPWIPSIAYMVIIVVGAVILFVMLFASRGPERVLLIVDDLDRCRPEQLLTVVESIKVLLEEPEISSRIQVAMLVEEDVLEQAILEKYERMGTVDQSAKGGKGGLGWSDQRICRENSEKLFTAHLRLPPLAKEELEEIMLKVVTKERPTKKDSAKPTPASVPNVAAQPPATQLPPPTLPDGTKPSLVPQTSIIKEIVFTETDEKALLAALPQLQIACEGFNLGPRSVRAFAFRYQLARLLLDQLKIEWMPNELAKALAENASHGRKAKSQGVAKTKMQRIIEQVA